MGGKLYLRVEPWYMKKQLEIVKKEGARVDRFQPDRWIFFGLGKNSAIELALVKKNIAAQFEVNWGLDIRTRNSSKWDELSV
ncbi:hypothetical protein U1Q18_051765, partial [Sarracenia purpurea var. burkii]